MLAQEIKQAAEEFERPVSGLLLSGVSAGLGVGLSFFLIATIASLTNEAVPQLVVEILKANAFAVGFIIVILGRMDLFTEFTTIAILPVLARQATLGALTRLWTVVYLGNILGAAVFGVLTAVLGKELGVITHPVLADLASDLTDHQWWVTLLSALLAGWMMGVLSWLITGGRDTTSQILFIWVITAAIGLAHLHHSITGTAEMSAAFLIGASNSFELLHFLLWTTVGNALGGILFAVSVVSSLHMRHKEAPESVKRTKD
jgi:formate/nitrite transporter FocA (FNT family)